MKINNTINLLIATIILLTASCNKVEIKDIHNTSCNAAIPLPSNHPQDSNYQQILDKFMNAGSVGTSITIISPNGVWSKGGGMADLKNQIPLEPCNLLRVASISKVYTATAVVKLYEQGKIDLDAKISEYLPQDLLSKIANGNKITVKQLLNHTAGVKNYILTTYNSWANNSIKALAAEENLKYIYNKPADFEPGTDFAYSNSGYLLLGMIIKSVTNQTAYAAITDLLVTPNNYTNTHLTTKPVLTTNGYRDFYDNGMMKDFSYVDENAVGGQDMTDGGIISNSYDVATFFHALMNNQIVSSSSLQLMQDWYKLDASPTEGFVTYEGYGLGLIKIKVKDKIAIGHFGLVNCYNTLVFHFPVENITICILNSSYSGKITKVHAGNTFYDHLFQ